MDSAATKSRVLQPNNLLDFLISGAVAAIALVFFVFMEVHTGIGKLTSYDVTAEMLNAGGLKLGTDVRIGGVKVGTITGLSLNPKSQLALVRMDLRDDLLLPADSYFSVSSGLMSDPYLSIVPGQGAANIRPGSVLRLPRKFSRQGAGV
jgi:phospholipid/cholesterol/gamma-HCH transport system substrate-binding protein